MVKHTEIDDSIYYGLKYYPDEGIEIFKKSLEEHKKNGPGPYYLKGPYDGSCIDRNNFFVKCLEIVCPYKLINPYDTDIDTHKACTIRDISAIDSNTDYAYSFIYFDSKDVNWNWMHPDVHPILYLSSKIIASMLVITYNYKSWNGE